MKRIYLFTMFCLMAAMVSAQSQFGEIRGEVKDKATGKPLEDASVALELNGVVKATTTTNEKGSFSFKTLSPGEYTIKLVLFGYEKIQLEDVTISVDQITYVKLEPSSTSNELKTFTKKGYKVPIINPDGVNGRTTTSKELTNIPTRNINGIVGQSANVNSIGGGNPNFSGARSSGTAYYIDGVRVIGSFNVPRSAIDQVQVVVGGTPAQYGDFVGGVINITTKGPSRKHQGGFEAISSSMFNPYHFNQFEYSLQGPIKVINKKSKAERVLLGYSTSGNVAYQKDQAPLYGGSYYLKPEVLAGLEQNPLRPSPTGTGFVNSTEFITKDDMVKYKANKNDPLLDVNLTGNINYQPTKNINIVLGGTLNYRDVIGYNFGNTLFNYSSNAHSVSNTLRGWVRFTHTLKKDERKAKDKEIKSNVSSAYYTIRFDYTQTNSLTEDARYKSDIFSYGYLGNFTTYRAPAYRVVNTGLYGQPRKFTYVDKITGQTKTIELSQFVEQTGMSDTLLTFERGGKNPIRENYTQYIYDYYKNKNQTISSGDELRFYTGLLNGDAPQSVYSMWNNVGAPGAGYGKSQVEQYTLFAMSEITLRSKKDPDKKHDLSFGLQYEQRIQRGYSVASTGIWSLMRQLAVKDRPVRDLSNPVLVFDDAGNFLDTIKYNLTVDPNTEGSFVKNMRKHLMESGAKDANGNPITQNSYIDVDMYTPDNYKLKYFSPDELLNNGSKFVDYFGYDVYGNRLKGKPAINDFFDSTKRTIGAFQPIYTAFFIQDKFAFKDLIFRIGVRIDRYDANTFVLKDPYSLYPVKTVREVRSESSPISQQLNSSVSDDAVVYVNDVESPTSIVGYRETNTNNGVTRWFDKNGSSINDPQLIANATSTGQIAPYLVNRAKSDRKITSNSFADYKPKFYINPRIWFKFPISTTAQFFANYDVLSQRPDAGNITTIDDYYFLIANATDVINNPALKPQRTTSYELGFKQQIGDNSGLSLIATYREMRDMVQIFRYSQAYPLNYTTFGNIDFGTVKGFRVEYELRDAGTKGNMNMSANYSLLFADGTGSNAGSQQSLINAGQPNLRTLFPLDFDIRHTIKGNFDFHFKDNDGPIYKGKYWLQNAGMNVIVQAFSGTPYTANSQPINEAQGGVVQRSQVRGSINGSRKPWIYNGDITFDKTWNLNTGKKEQREGKRVMNLNAYIWISNVLNTKNVTGVYRYTGSATDDGYLASAQGQQAVQRALSSQSFIDLYSTRVQNPGLFLQPRLIRLGFRFNF
jgi:hypothetical protein